MDFYSLVPKELEANLQYRLDLRRRAAEDPRFRRACTAASRRDILFWLNAFVWLYEPRPRVENGRPLPMVIPFITWPHQDEFILAVKGRLGYEDIAVEKSRGEGASWIGAMLALHDWLFEPLTAIGLVSKDENAVDDPEDPDSLMWKSLAVGTPVLTPTGWVPVESVKEGGSVIGADGRPTRVKQTLPEYDAKMVRVTFSDGTAVECTEDHLWSVSSVKDRMSGSREKTYNHYVLKTAVEIGESLRDGSSRGKHWNWQVHGTPPVDFPRACQPIPPYTLGVLIGDGCFSKFSIEFASVDDEVVNAVKEELPGFQVRSTGRCSWIISKGNSGGSQSNPLSQALCDLGLKGKRAWEKHIPAEYLFSSRDQRLSLLRGLMDTDGTVCAQGGFSYYSTTSSVLAKDVSDLVRSLGGQSRVRCYERKGGRKEYRVSVGLTEDNPFFLSRKASRWKPRSHTVSRRIISVEPVGTGKAKCISVEAKDGLFVVDGFLVTHNCDWELTKLPRWMAGVKDVDYKRKLSEHTLRNLRNGSTIVGYAATGNVASGGRKKWFLMDELAKFPRGDDEKAMASTQHVTDSRLVISTPVGSDGAYYQVMHEPSNMVKVVLDWKDNPVRRRGLYQMVGGKPIALESDNPLPPGYRPPDQEVLDRYSRLRRKGFKLEGTTRSPWYDRECDRMMATPQNIAQELDRSYGGSMFRIYTEDFNARAESSVRIPFTRGMLGYHSESLEPDFETSSNGQFLLWVNLDGRRRPPRSMYVIGADISTGLGGAYTSNSTLEVVDIVTMEQVAELATNTMDPVDFADLAIASSKWFWGAYLIWEANGPGAAFTKRVIAQKYPNIYYRTALFKRGGKRLKTKEPGWWSDNKSREAMHSELSRSVRTGELVLRSRDLVRETGQYIRDRGKITHVQVASATDDAAGEAHGDRVVGMCVCIQGVRDRPLFKDSVEEKGDPEAYPGSSPAARLKEYEDSLRADPVWDDRSNWDMARSRMGAW